MNNADVNTFLYLFQLEFLRYIFQNSFLKKLSRVEVIEEDRRQRLREFSNLRHS